MVGKPQASPFKRLAKKVLSAKNRRRTIEVIREEERFKLWETRDMLRKIELFVSQRKMKEMRPEKRPPHTDYRPSGLGQLMRDKATLNDPVYKALSKEYERLMKNFITCRKVNEERSVIRERMELIGKAIDKLAYREMNKKEYEEWEKVFEIKLE
ncbi:MAG: hypothetical protein V1776_03035 [Candidatus Diapherotrites archaeon]